MTDEIRSRLKELEAARQKLAEQIETSQKALQELDKKIAETKDELVRDG